MQANHFEATNEQYHASPGESNSKRPVPKPGVYKDVPFDEYKSWDAMNASLLKKAKTMRHLYEEIQCPQPFKPSDDMRIGTLLHAMQFEPDTLLRDYVVMPDFVAEIEKEYPQKWTNIRSTTEYKNRVEAWQKESQDKEIVEADWIERVERMHFNLSVHPLASEYLSTPADSEICLVWVDPETGILCKSRIDHLQHKDQSFTDLKSTADAARAEKQIESLQYDFSLAMYREGIMHCFGGELYEPRLVFVENNGLHLVRAAPLSQEALDRGHKRYKETLRKLARCLESGDWPGYEDPSAWCSTTKEQVTLSVQGMKVTL